MEYARNVLGIPDAAHEETIPDASIRFISKLNCSLVGETQIIHVTRDTLSFQAYREEKVIEQFHCNYGLNEDYRDEMVNGALKIVGIDTNGSARIVELLNHRFFVATLFLPQLSSTPRAPHPLIKAYIKAAIAFRDIKQKSEVKM